MRCYKTNLNYIATILNQCYNAYMSKSYLKEKASCLRNEMNHLWGAIFVTGGGSFGLSVVEYKTIWIYFLIFLGFIWAIIFINAYIVRGTELAKIIEQLRNGEQ